MNGYGVDWLGVSFPVARFDRLAFASESATRHADGGAVRAQRFKKTFRWGDSPDAGTVTVCVGLRPGGWTGTVDYNPSRLWQPDGAGLVDLPTFLENVPSALTQAVEALDVEPSQERAQWLVTRLDVARDFTGVSAPGALIEGLRGQRRAYASDLVVHYDPKTNVAQTLRFGSKTRSVRLYDRQAAHPGKGLPSGSVRWEAQMRRGWLRRRNMARVEDLTVPHLVRLTDEMWLWSKCDVPATRTAPVIDALERLQASGEISPAKAMRLLGEVALRSAGRSWQTDPKTAKHYETLIESLGWLQSSDLPVPYDGGLGESRLDWSSGTETRGHTAV